MQPRQSYQAAASMSWTRIDMLLKIYDHALTALASGADAITTGQEQQVLESRFQAQKAILLLCDGLDLEQGELPQRIMQLCAFSLEKIASNNVDDWNAVHGVLGNVRDGFAQIRDEANRLENARVIPPLVV
jgi:flagellar protein FliS